MKGFVPVNMNLLKKCTIARIGQDVLSFNLSNFSRLVAKSAGGGCALFTCLPTVPKRTYVVLAATGNTKALYDGKCGMSSAIVPAKACYSTNPKPAGNERRASEGKSIARSSGDSGAVTLSLGEKVKENAKTGGYGLVILAGIAVTGSLVWVILSELFSSESPNNIYTHAFKLCKLSPEVNDALGSPIKCYGEESRRGWRRHVSHVEFMQGNTKFLRMRFFVEGPFKKGTVHLEKKQNDRGKYEYTYLIVEVDGYPPRRIDVHF